MFFTVFFCAYDYDSKEKAKQYTENFTAMFQNSNQYSTFSWVSLIRLGLGATLLGWPKSIYYLQALVWSQVLRWERWESVTLPVLGCVENEDEKNEDQRPKTHWSKTRVACESDNVIFPGKPNSCCPRWINVQVMHSRHLRLYMK